jgi:hypothetical protein
MSRRNYDRLVTSTASPPQHRASRSSDGLSEDDDGNATSAPPILSIELVSTNRSNNNNGSSNRIIRRPRRHYSRVATSLPNEVDEEDDEGCEDVPLNDDVNANNARKNSGDSGPSASKSLFSIKILDFAQQTFEIQGADSSWTVGRLKQEGVQVHRVPVPLQRLVYSGKLLQDDSTLGSVGIKSGSIVHLFPKPRVVIQQGTGGDAAATAASASPSSSHSQPAIDSDGPSSGQGARVPTIVLDVDEAQQRSQILVLGSVEYMEAQNNVKLFSFMLLVISAIELLNLLAMAMGVPQDGGASGASNPFYPASDDIPTYDDAGYDYWQKHGHGGNATGGGGNYSGKQHGSTTTDPNLILYQDRWGWPNTIDFIISAGGVYVALMGIQASNENARRLAKVYLIGTVLVGIGWMIFNYYVTVQIDEAIASNQQQQQPQPDGVPSTMDQDDIYKSALSVMLLPGMVWVLCCLRAAQFHQLLSDAESEAEDRIRAQMEESSALAQSPPAQSSSAPESPTAPSLATIV